MKDTPLVYPSTFQRILLITAISMAATYYCMRLVTPAAQAHYQKHFSLSATRTALKNYELYEASYPACSQNLLSEATLSALNTQRRDLLSQAPTPFLRSLEAGTQYLWQAPLVQQATALSTLLISVLMLLGYRTLRLLALAPSVILLSVLFSLVETTKGDSQYNSALESVKPPPEIEESLICRYSLPERANHDETKIATANKSLSSPLPPEAEFLNRLRTSGLIHTIPTDHSEWAEAMRIHLKYTYTPPSYFKFHSLQEQKLAAETLFAADLALSPPPLLPNYIPPKLVYGFCLAAALLIGLCLL